MGDLFKSLLNNKYLWNIIKYYLKIGHTKWKSYEDFTNLGSIVENGYWSLLKDKIKNDLYSLSFHGSLLYDVIYSFDMELIDLVYRTYKNKIFLTEDEFSKLVNSYDFQSYDKREFLCDFLKYILKNHKDIYIPSLVIEHLLSNTKHKDELNRYLGFMNLATPDSNLYNLACSKNCLPLVEYLYEKDDFKFTSKSISLGCRSSSIEVLDYLIKVKKLKFQECLIDAISSSNIYILNLIADNDRMSLTQIQNIDICKLIDSGNKNAEVFIFILKEILKSRKITVAYHFKRKLSYEYTIKLLSIFDMKSLFIIFKEFNISQSIIPKISIHNIALASFKEFHPTHPRLEMIKFLNSKGIEIDYSHYPLESLLSCAKNTIELEFVEYLCEIKNEIVTTSCINTYLQNCQDADPKIFQYLLAKYVPVANESIRFEKPKNIHILMALYSYNDAPITIDLMKHIVGLKNINMIKFAINNIPEAREQVSYFLIQKLFSEVDFLTIHGICSLSDFNVQQLPPDALLPIFQMAFLYGNLRILKYIASCFPPDKKPIINFDTLKLESSKNHSFKTLEFLLEKGDCRVSDSLITFIYMNGNLRWLQNILRNYSKLERRLSPIRGNNLVKYLINERCNSNRVAFHQFIIKELTVPHVSYRTVTLTQESDFLEYSIFDGDGKFTIQNYLASDYYTSNFFKLSVISTLLRPFQSKPPSKKNQHTLREVLDLIFRSSDLSIIHWFIFNFPSVFEEGLVEKLFQPEVITKLHFSVFNLLLDKILTFYPISKKSMEFYEWLSLLALKSKKVELRIFMIKLIMDRFECKLNTKTHKNQLTIIRDIFNFHKINQDYQEQMSSLYLLKEKNLFYLNNSSPQPKLIFSENKIINKSYQLLPIPDSVRNSVDKAPRVSICIRNEFGCGQPIKLSSKENYTIP